MGKFRKSRSSGINARQTRAIKKNTKAIKELRKPQEMKWLDDKVALIPILNGVFDVLNDVTTVVFRTLKSFCDVGCR